MKAVLKNYHQSPRKVRLVTELVKGQSVKEALSRLDFVSKDAAQAVRGLVLSASANAKTNFKQEADNLYIKEITVNKGIVIKRSRPRARGRAFPIHRRTSHITVLLDVIPVKTERVKPVAEKKVAKKKVVKK